MHNAADVLAQFVLEKLVDEPIANRAKIYRALAAVSAPRQQKRLLGLAAECEAITAAHEQMMFDFQQRSKKSRRGPSGPDASKN